MKFQTQVKLPASSPSYSHASSFVCLGSCFAAEIGERLRTSLFDCTTNPLGNLFNPLAMAEIITRSVKNRCFEEDEFFEHQELWRHFLVHSKLSSTDKQTAIESANKALQSLRAKLLKTDLLILTLGSAWVYQKAGYSGYIGHNHKLPLSSFQKSKLTPDEIALTLARSFRLLQKSNPSLNVCITVSPVRHLRDGLHENNLSKASLLLAVDQLQTHNEKLSYFPAYELLIDELRDYRFYAEDLSHPSRPAADYIWSQFRDCYMDAASRNLIAEVDAVLAMLNHRACHRDTSQYASFKSSLQEKIQSLAAKLPQSASYLEKRFEHLP